jgi:pyruvate ferredoxin oxidoreductase gamma subunit
VREILIIGRGGQGAQTAGNLLAQAFFAEGHFVQTFSTYGGARRGTPVTSSIRVNDQPLRLRCDIECADAMLCFDDSLLDQNFLSRVDSETMIVVNSTRSGEQLSALGEYRITPLDGREIARKNDMGKVVNSPLLGAFVAVLGDPDIETMCEVIERTAPIKQQQNIAACRQAYEQLRNLA